jgi:hypothetical protein
MSDDTPIEFEKLDWGSFTKQSQNAGFGKRNLLGFSKYVLGHPKRFREKTRNRARFYMNVIAKNK